MEFRNTKILVTGCAGFIGSNLVDRLLGEKALIVGVDNFNNFYDPKVKYNNLKQARSNKNFKLYKLDILDYNKLSKIFIKEKPSIVIHLAAQAGVRPSIFDPVLYAKVNVLGTVNLLKLSAQYRVSQFIFGSSSSVYGNSPNLPFAEDDLCQNIISPYGASKRAAEIFVESFSKIHKLKSTILRFFSVYGPRGRPDMAIALFCNFIKFNQAITQYGDGKSSRDYTYIDDIADGIIKAMEKEFDFEIINLGNNHSVSLGDLIKTIEKISGKKAKIKKMPQVPGDANFTLAEISRAKKMINWVPHTPIKVGIKQYWNWLG